MPGTSGGTAWPSTATAFSASPPKGRKHSGLISLPTWLIVVIAIVVFIIILKFLWGTMKAFVKFFVFVVVLGLIVWLGFRYFGG